MQPQAGSTRTETDGSAGVRNQILPNSRVSSPSPESAFVGARLTDAGNSVFADVGQSHEFAD